MKNFTSIELRDFPLWSRMKKHRGLLSFDLEITARCNNDCRHCYINLPAGDRAARSRELTLQEIGPIADQAVELGALWVLVSGGEPLLREDFREIYLLLKGKGLLVSVFTNATLIRDAHMDLFKRYPPRDIEVTVYGSTEETYERVTGRPGSYRAFRAGLDLLDKGKIKVRLKAMALRSNVHELQEIAGFCRARTKDFYRFDPQLHLRFDRNQARNLLIRSERLKPAEIAAIERTDGTRFASLQKHCDILTNRGSSHTGCDHLFHCGLGNSSFNVGFDGTFRLCSSLWAPGTVYDLRQGTLREAWKTFAPKVRDMRSGRPEYLENCRNCPIINLCLWCPAHAHLETGELDAPVEYFCRVARARAAAIQGGCPP
jgi:radical SAM protein with 4Fe4S-binding SPASM domain